MFAKNHKLTAALGTGAVLLGLAAPALAFSQQTSGDPGAGWGPIQILDRPGASLDRSLAMARYREAYSRARAAGTVSKQDPSKLVGLSTAVLEKRARKLTRAAAGAGSASPAGGVASPESYGVSQSTLDAIAACESGGNPAAVSPDGTYRGLYQFDYATWASVGGSGDPAAASPAEQSMRAAMLYSRAGSSPWPICG